MLHMLIITVIVQLQTGTALATLTSGPFVSQEECLTYTQAAKKMAQEDLAGAPVQRLTVTCSPIMPTDILEKHLSQRGS